MIRLREQLVLPTIRSQAQFSIRSSHRGLYSELGLSCFVPFQNNFRSQNRSILGKSRAKSMSPFFEGSPGSAFSLGVTKRGSTFVRDFLTNVACFRSMHRTDEPNRAILKRKFRGRIQIESNLRFARVECVLSSLSFWNRYFLKSHAETRDSR